VKRLFNKKNSTILGIILIILGIPLTVFILKSQTVLESNASDSPGPQNIKITNVSDKSFTITYQTNTATTGSISYGENKQLGKSELDDTDKEKGVFSSKKIHSISAKNLASNTKYYLTIISGSDTYLNNNLPFEVTTGPDISSASAKEMTIKGKVILPDGNDSPDTLVLLNTENSQFLSSITAQDGKFSFSLNDLRTNDLSSILDANNNTVYKIFATNGSLSSTTLTSLKNTSSIPTITLSNDYDFTQEASPVASTSAEFLGFPLVTSSKNKFEPKITNPKENQSFSDQKPKFKGTGLPNQKVEIIIHSTGELTAQVTADGNGNWTYQPPENLSSGNHTITIKTRDSTGILRTIVQSFTVYAAESNTPTPTIPLATATLTPTPTRTILIPTSTPILFPTDNPLLGQTVNGPKGGLPPTGNPPIVLVISGIIMILMGFSLFAFTRKTSL
jgi:hypothetical protein